MSRRDATNTKPSTPAEMTTATMDITPAQAAEFLKLNSSNRPLRLSWVKKLTAIIERGEWMLTHQGIAITSDNRLLDGQHRLKAIVASGKTVPMNVSFDCDPASFTVIDGGVKRTISDQLATPPVMVAVARNLWNLPHRTESKTPTSAQVAEVLSWSRDVIDEVMSTAKARNKRTSASVQTPLVVHLMAGRPEVMPAFVAFRDLDFDSMPASIKSLTRQVMEGTSSVRNNQWDLMARVWRAFDPSNWSNNKVQIKDVNAACNEMLRVADAFKRRRLK